MPMQVCMGAMMQCTFGMAPSSLVVLSTNRVLTNQMPDVNIMDHVPLVNIMPFRYDHAFRYVHVARKPDGGRSNFRGDGSSHADALYSQHTGPMGSWCADGASGQLSHTRQYIAVDVHLGGRNYVHRSGRRDGRGSVEVEFFRCTRFSKDSGQTSSLMQFRNVGEALQHDRILGGFA